METTTFDYIYDKYQITKPIRLIQLFGGYGSQYFALKYLGANVEHWKLCEWAVKSIQAYKDAHCYNDNTDYSKELSKDNIINYLYSKGISQSYNEPMNIQQIKRLNENQLRNIYNNIISTKNLVNIQQVKGNNLEIINKADYEYIMTYSFPCQDLSLAGRQKGMNKNSGTRSSMLWEVERILNELNETNSLPQILLMENVPQVHGTKNKENFDMWLKFLEHLGYKNFYKDLTATDYGIPQKRNRTFMVSILGNYSYTFPNSIPLELKLKDMLEDHVDEKYCLSDRMQKYIFSEDDKYIVNKNSLRLNRDIAVTKTTREGNTRADSSDYIIVQEATEGFVKEYGGNKIDLEQFELINLRMTTAQDLKIRKLTPREAFRLMGVKDEDYERIASNQSNSSLYHLAGDSIVINVLMAIFNGLGL